jgi:hypothetical protein
MLTIIIQNRSLLSWRYQLGEIVKPYADDTQFDPNNPEAISASVCKLIANHQFAEAEVIEKNEQLTALHNELEWVRATSDAQVQFLFCSIKIMINLGSNSTDRFPSLLTHASSIGAPWLRSLQ